MLLPEKVIQRRYHALDHDWTPLSRNPCWLSNAFHCLRDYVKRNRPSLISSADTFAKESFSNHKLHCAGDKSIADDFGASRYCKCESSLCATIHWGFSCVPTICSSLKLNFWYTDLTMMNSRIRNPLKIQFRAKWKYVDTKCNTNGTGVTFSVYISDGLKTTAESMRHGNCAKTGGTAYVYISSHNFSLELRNLRFGKTVAA